MLIDRRRQNRAKRRSSFREVIRGGRLDDQVSDRARAIVVFSWGTVEDFAARQLSEFYLTSLRDRRGEEHADLRQMRGVFSKAVAETADFDVTERSVVRSLAQAAPTTAPRLYD